MPIPCAIDEVLIDFQGGGLRDLRSELGPEFCQVVSEQRGLVAGINPAGLLCAAASTVSSSMVMNSAIARDQ